MTGNQADHYMNDGHPECEDNFFLWSPPKDLTPESLRSSLTVMRQLEQIARARGNDDTANDWVELIAAYHVALQRAEAESSRPAPTPSCTTTSSQ